MMPGWSYFASSGYAISAQPRGDSVVAWDPAAAVTMLRQLPFFIALPKVSGLSR